MGLGDPSERIGRRQEQAVVGPDQEAPVAAAQRKRPAVAGM
jgi:hypothetical protein